MFLLLVCAFAPTARGRSAPLALCPDNPHYLLFRGKPVFLLGSTEHYGAVLNRDFNDHRYLDALQHDGMNVTRLFSGAYVEPAGAFHIDKNTLAPVAGRLLCPWARAGEAGYANGGGKFDLSRWDQAYFARLRDFVSEAGKRGIVVEVVLFCPYYDERQWTLSPLNSGNNVNGIGTVPRTQANTLTNGNLLAVQDAMVRKIADELKDADNIYYEICNEPYFGGVTLEWQYHILATLRAAEKNLPHRHLAAQNIGNGSQKIQKPNPGVSIFNFHYATPPDAVAVNYGLGRVIADDETGFKGTGDAAYRKEAWEFMLAGGGIFDHLDYSFAVGHEDGSFKFPPTQPGGGGPELRRQFKILASFLAGFDFIHMTPDAAIVRSPLPKGVSAHFLADKGRAYAGYIHGAGCKQVELAIAPGAYKVEWIDVKSGKVREKQEVDFGERHETLTVPAYTQEIALRIVADKPSP
ncbi:MAG TPA: cellulase family glycosylhydrolase [Tepidisphaeraceae bacterium]|nr:cellulase family glycosylhydrolase [Tepidisphaeraceae bacterium]